MKIFNLFISHSWAHRDAYDGLVALLRQRPHFKFKDFSVPKDHPIHDAPNADLLREAIRLKMSPCSAVLVLAGVYATYSKWIEKEIHLAKNGFGVAKPIIAVEPWGSEKTSVRVKHAADRIVKWNTDSIVQAIREIA